MLFPAAGCCDAVRCDVDAPVIYIMLVPVIFGRNNRAVVGVPVYALKNYVQSTSNQCTYCPLCPCSVPPVAAVPAVAGWGYLTLPRRPVSFT